MRFQNLMTVCYEVRVEAVCLMKANWDVRFAVRKRENPCAETNEQCSP